MRLLKQYKDVNIHKTFMQFHRKLTIENTDHFFTDAEILHLKIKQTFLCHALVVKKKYYLPTEIPRVKYNYTGRLLPIFVCLNFF